MTKKIPTKCYTQTHKPQIQSEAKKKKACNIYEHPNQDKIKSTTNKR